jgi:hypothetical protein
VGRAYRAGRNRVWLVVGPRVISLRDDPLVCERPLDPKGRVIPANPARRVRNVLVRHLVGDLRVVHERLIALGEALWDVEQPAVRRAELNAEPPQVCR